MQLAEYRLNDHTYLFDTSNVPHGAELVTEDIATGEVTLFPDQVEPAVEEVKTEEVKEAPAPKNKAAKPAANKAAEAPASTPTAE